MVPLTYNLPSFPTAGNWTIRVEAMLQKYEWQFLVERYYIPFFEVMPAAPAYALDSDESYTMAVQVSFAKGRVPKANTTILVYARPINSSFADFKLVSEEHPPWV